MLDYLAGARVTKEKIFMTLKPGGEQSEGEFTSNIIFSEILLALLYYR